MDDVNDKLVARLRARQEFGKQKYGSDGLHPWDGRNTTQDAIEELCDLFVYLEKLRIEREQVSNLLIRARNAILNNAVGESQLVIELTVVSNALRADIPRIGVNSTADASSSSSEAI